MCTTKKRHFSACNHTYVVKRCELELCTEGSEIAEIEKNYGICTICRTYDSLTPPSDIALLKAKIVNLEKKVRELQAQADLNKSNKKPTTTHTKPKVPTLAVQNLPKQDSKNLDPLTLRTSLSSLRKSLDALDRELESKMIRLKGTVNEHGEVEEAIIEEGEEELGEEQRERKMREIMGEGEMRVLGWDEWWEYKYKRREVIVGLEDGVCGVLEGC